MTEEQFDLIVESRLTQIKNTLLIKGKEYRRNSDPLHNFNEASRILNCTPSKALLGFATKHLVSILDIIEDHSKGNLSNVDSLNEKIGDMINYLILLEATLTNDIIDVK